MLCKEKMADLSVSCVGWEKVTCITELDRLTSTCLQAVGMVMKIWLDKAMLMANRGVHSSHFWSHFWFHFSEKWDEKWSQKWGEKWLKNIHFSKMDIVSVFDTFPFFIHFSSSVFQVAKECFGIVRPFCCCPIWQSSHFVHHPHDRTSKKIKIKNF